MEVFLPGVWLSLLQSTGRQKLSSHFPTWPPLFLNFPVIVLDVQRPPPHLVLPASDSLLSFDFLPLRFHYQLYYRERLCRAPAV